MIKFDITGTMKVDTSIPGAYTSTRNEVESGFVLIAEDPTMEIVSVTVGFGDKPSLKADVIFTYKVGTEEKKDFITFELESGILASAFIPLDDLKLGIGATPDILTLLSSAITAIAPDIVTVLADGVIATSAKAPKP